MSTSPDSIAYPQAVAEVAAPSEAVEWVSTYRPANPWPGLFGWASDLETLEVWSGSEWLHPIWEGAPWNFPVHITDTTESTSPTTGALVVDGGVGIGKRLNVGGAFEVAGISTLAAMTATAGAFSATLGVADAATFDDDVTVDGLFTANGAAQFGGTVDVTGLVTLAGGIHVTGPISFTGNVGITGNATVSGTFTGTGAASFGNTVSVMGNATLSAGLAVTGNATVGGTFGATGAATLGNSLTVTGAATLSSTLGVTGASTLGNYVLATGAGLASTNPNTLEIVRTNLTGAATGNTYWAFKSGLSFSDTTGPGGVHFNGAFTSNVYSNAEPGELWNVFSRVYTGSTKAASKNVVAFYGQVERDPTLPLTEGVPLIGGVLEVRSASGADAASDGIMQGLEIDIAANGTVTSAQYRQFLLLLGKKGDMGGSDVSISNLISTQSYSGNMTFERGMRFGSGITYTTAVLDLTPLTEGPSANAVWLGTGQHIALNTGGTARIYSDATNVNFTKSVRMGTATDTSVTFDLLGVSGTSRVHRFYTGSTLAFSNGLGAGDNWVVGWYVGGAFQGSVLYIGSTTGNVRVGTGVALSTSATTGGFLQIPTCAGTPTGAVGSVGAAAVVYDSTNQKLYVNSGSGWTAIN